MFKSTLLFFCIMILLSVITPSVAMNKSAPLFKSWSLLSLFRKPAVDKDVQTPSDVINEWTDLEKNTVGLIKEKESTEDQSSSQSGATTIEEKVKESCAKGIIAALANQREKNFGCSYEQQLLLLWN